LIIDVTNQALSAGLAMSPQAIFTQWCQKILKLHFFHLHNISHHGRLATQCLVSSRYVCCSLVKDMAAWAKTCLHWQQSKIYCHARTQPLHICVPQQH
jgi:hypothetical protein